MAYSLKKAGVEFLATIDVSPDLTGKAANFSAKFRNNTTGVVTDVAAAFTELAASAGTYQVPMTIPVTGDFTVIINNSTDGLGSIVAPVVVMAASLDDIKLAVDGLNTKMDSVKTQVDLLDEAALNGLEAKVNTLTTTLNNVKTLIDDEDGATVNSVLEFVEKIDAALSNGGGGLSALEGYTDDIENMLLGTEFLADGTTPNPLFGNTNINIMAALNNVTTGLPAIKTAMTDAKASIETKIDTLKTDLQADVAAVKVVVDANKATLENAGFGLSALKTAIDTLGTALTAHDTDIKAILNSATFGLEALKNLITTRFDAVDTKLTSIDGKVSAMGASVSGKVFI